MDIHVFYIMSKIRRTLYKLYIFLLSCFSGTKHEEMRKKVQIDVKKCPDFAITHDGWTSANTESYNTVTGHFINPEWELKSVVLETTKVEGSHTAENIASSLRETQQAWSFVTPTAVTDNAANEKKALELLQWVRFGCYGHNQSCF